MDSSLITNLFIRVSDNICVKVVVLGKEETILPSVLVKECLNGGEERLFTSAEANSLLQEDDFFLLVCKKDTQRVIFFCREDGMVTVTKIRQRERDLLEIKRFHISNFDGYLHYGDVIIVKV